jgi:hypothetical protein
VKGALTVAENLQFWARYLGPRRYPARRQPARRSGDPRPHRHGARRGRPHPPGRSPGRLPVGRAEASPLCRAPGRGRAADLAPGRAHLGARCGEPGAPGRADASTSRHRRVDPGRHPWGDRHRRRRAAARWRGSAGAPAGGAAP